MGKNQKINRIKKIIGGGEVKLIMMIMSLISGRIPDSKAEYSVRSYIVVSNLSTIWLIYLLYTKYMTGGLNSETCSVLVAGSSRVLRIFGKRGMKCPIFSRKPIFLIYPLPLPLRAEKSFYV